MDTILFEKDRQKRFLFFVIMSCIPVITIFIAYIGFTVYKTVPLYSYVKTGQQRWSGKVHRADTVLGFAPIPDSRGEQIFPIGPDIPIRYDANGFRVPVNYTYSLPYSPIILTLGCSFTYGSANYAEDTYPYLLGQYLEGTSYNAGVSSYGLSQMLILARRLVPAHKPDYLIVQYSPWLIYRSITPFAPTLFGKFPNPFFYKKNDGLALHPPVFKTVAPDVPIDKYRHSPRGMIDFIAFIWDVGLPLYSHDDSNMFFYEFKKAIGIIPKPATDGTEVVKYVYSELATIAKENDARLVIVVLGDGPEPVQVPYHLFPQDVQVVDAHQPLLDSLRVINSQNYAAEYAHWRKNRGGTLVPVDLHPNKKAHKIIAEKIVKAITSFHNKGLK